jgi:asparagine synthase (glutamine-hydrolysing)
LFALIFGRHQHAPSATLSPPDYELIETEVSALHPNGICVRSLSPAYHRLSAGSFFHCPQTGQQLLAWLRLDNRIELTEALGFSAPNCSDAQLLFAAYARWQEDCVRHLIGDFSFALYDPQRDIVLMARDPLGVRPLYYRLENDFLAVSTSPAPLLNIAGKPATRDMDWAAHYLMHLSMHHTRTAYIEISKLAPAHYAIVNRETVQTRRYFNWRDDAPHARQRDASWVRSYRKQLELAVRSRLNPDANVACENSGGLDSATITGLSALILGSDKVHSFGYAVLEQEAQFILATSQMHKIQSNHIFTNYARLSDADIDRMLEVLAYPAEHGNGPGHLAVYELCSKFNLTTLLSGFGGDEVVTNPGYHLAHELADQNDWCNLWQIMPGNSVTRSLRMAKRIWQKWRPAKHNAEFARTWQHRWQFHPLQTQVVEKLSIRQTFFAQPTYDAPYRRINDFAIHNKLAAGFLPTRLENCSLLAAMYGIDYRWPLLDQRLVQQYLSTPAIEKYGSKGMGRYLHRRAMEGITPPLVQWKPSKDMGVDSFMKEFQSSQKLQVLAEKLDAELERLPSALQDIVDVPKLKNALMKLNTLHGENLHAAIFSLQRTAHALHWLNRWLVRPL